MKKTTGDPMEKLGDRVGHARKLRGVKFNEIDRHLGKDTGYASRLIANKRERPDHKTIQKIAEFLDVSFLWLLTGEGEIQANQPAPPPLTHSDVPPTMRDDPAWEAELEKARERRPRNLPAELLETAGKAFVPGVAVTWDNIIRVAEMIWVNRPAPTQPEPTAPAKTHS